MGANPPDGASRPTGRFTYDPRTGKWDWDDEVYRIHGYPPGSVTPTFELVMASKHPDDRGRFEAALTRAAEDGGPFSLSYRIVAADGVERRVVMMGESEPCEPDDSHGANTIEGYYADLTPDFDRDSSEAADAAVAASAESRAEIEQAKGALMAAYGLEPDAAFAMLRWWSRNHNVKVRDLAQRLVALARQGSTTNSEVRSAYDALLHDVSDDG